MYRCFRNWGKEGEGRGEMPTIAGTENHRERKKKITASIVSTNRMRFPASADTSAKRTLRFFFSNVRWVGWSKRSISKAKMPINRGFSNYNSRAKCCKKKLLSRKKHENAISTSANENKGRFNSNFNCGVQESSWFLHPAGSGVGGWVSLLGRIYRFVCKC